MPSSAATTATATTAPTTEPTATTPTTATSAPTTAAKATTPTSAAPASPAAALRPDDLAGYLNRTRMLVGDDVLARLATKTVAIAGCGGMGGAVAITLARMGVGGFQLADPAGFDAPDINRQWAASHATLGRNKAETYAETLRSIQPDVRLATYVEGVTEANLADFLDGADVVVDCLDVSVPPMLRVALYQHARALGLHCLSAPMLGFGAILVDAAPDGMPMEALYGRVFAEAVATSRLPATLRDLVVPEHIDAIERHLRDLKAPSVAISPMLSGALLSTEIFLLLAGDDTPGWRPPHVLPDVMVVDPIRGTYRVLPLPELVAGPPAGGGDGPAPSRASTPGAAAATAAATSGPSGQGVATTPAASTSDVPATPDGRRTALAAAGWNTVRLPHAAVAVDLLSDSWRERAPATAPPDAAAPPPATPRPADGSDLEAAIAAAYGLPHVVAVHRGRFAEALLAQAALRPGGVVATNALFPTTRHHIAHAGGRILELGRSESDDLYDPFPFKGELDLDRLAAALAGDGVGDGEAADGGAAPVQAIWLELGANAVGGQPVRLGQLRAVRILADAHGVPLFVDATRAYANAALLREHEPGQALRPLRDIVHDLCACATACTASLSKDFVTPTGGFVATADRALFVGLRDLALLAYGDGLGAADRAAAAAAVTDGAGDDAPFAARLDSVLRLHAALAARSIPVVGPPGGHAVFVDAAAFLPHLGPDDHRAAALSIAVYLAGGVRIGAQLPTPRQAAAGVDLVRLAVPVGGLTDADLATVAETFRRVHLDRARLGPWTRAGDDGGLVGALWGAYEAVGVGEERACA